MVTREERLSLKIFGLFLLFFLLCPIEICFLQSNSISTLKLQRIDQILFKSDSCASTSWIMTMRDDYKK